MPELFDNPQGEELDEEVQVFYLCRLLKVLRGSLLPHVTHDIEASVEDLLTAISQHFKAIGGLQGEQSLRNLEMGLLREGCYWPEDFLPSGPEA